MNRKLFMLRLYKKYGKDVIDNAVNTLGENDLNLLNEGRVDVLTPFIDAILYGNRRIMKKLY